MKYFIIWSGDYDHCEVEEFSDIQAGKVEKRLTELLNKIEGRKHGGHIEAVIYGEKVEYEVVNRVKEIRLKG